MKKIKKYKLLLSINIIISIFITLTGCKSNPQSNLSQLSTDYIANFIKDNVIFKDDLQKIDDKDILQTIYPNIVTNQIDEFSVYTSASGATAEELAIFKLNKNSDIDDFKQVLKNRINNQIANFENYIPEEVYKIKNSIINDYENIVIFVSCDTPSDVEISLEKLYNNN